MRKAEFLPISDRLHPVSSAFLFLITVLIGFIIVGPLIGTLVVSLIYDGTLMDLINKLQDPTGEGSFRIYMFVLQGFATGIGLVLIPWFYLKIVNKKSLSFLSQGESIKPLLLLTTLIIVFSFMVVNSLFIEWNANITLPESLSGLEGWMRASEERAAELTKYMTTFDTTGEFIIAMIVIAVLPALGEELVFRGFIQTELSAGFKNPHIAIWISAFIFSAIHIQFFGFFPRLFLGALFGYIYFWSGNLWYPITAHFIQNGGQILLLYLVQKGIIDIEIDNPESFPITIIILFSFITFGLLFYFRKTFSKPN